MTIRLLAAACLLLAAANTHAQVTPAVEREAVRRAVLDYVEGFYEGDTAKLTRALRPDLSKYGFWRDSTGKYDGERMTFAEAIAYGKKVKAQNRPVKASWPKDVVIFEVQDQTASAKVTAWWGTDYLLLGRFEGKWMITDVLWQGPLKR
ncbi:MAG TPA: nuclear transport factor 2 family protein [Gemmatimonadaceae bacterium]|nr:nuclear transport factor 2 family protein [Gemmatimonadaceae bacterium]